MGGADGAWTCADGNGGCDVCRARVCPCLPHLRGRGFRRSIDLPIASHNCMHAGEEGWLATHVALSSGSSEGGGMEEVELGAGPTAAVPTGGGEATASASPVDVVLVEGTEGGIASSSKEEEGEEGGAAVLLAPGMVTVVDQHFAAVREGEDSPTPGSNLKGGRDDGAMGAAAAAAAAGASSAAAGADDDDNDDDTGYADLASYEEAALAAEAAGDEVRKEGKTEEGLLFH
jgi:hypothetical protein